MTVPPPLPLGKDSLSFLPVTDVCEPGFYWLNFSKRAGTAVASQTPAPGKGHPVGERTGLKMSQSDSSFLLPGREETGQRTGVLREP